MDTALLAELQAAVGTKNVTSASIDAEVYGYDASLAVSRPGAVVFPADTQEVAAVVKAAAEAGLPFVPRGFGTNLSGGSVVSAGGLVICLSRLNRILSINPARRTAVVQPGATNLELQNALARHGFFYAPDPASQKVATLGGNVGENSGGPRCIKYGVTKNHVLGLECVLENGQILQTGGQTFDFPGLDLTGALIGSEGTLGIVTQVTVKILPLPESVVTLLAVYDDVAHAASSVAQICRGGIQPSALEMMDAPVMRAVEESYPCGYPLDAAAVLIIEVEGVAAGLKTQATRIKEICRLNGCRSVDEARDAQQRDQLWAGRRGAFGAVARLAPNYLVADCTVPRTELPRALAQVADIAAKHGLEHGNVFHAGDGNLHPLLFFDSRDSDQLVRVRKAGWEIMETCVALGGTITGEHGVGLEKLEAMHMIFNEADLAAQRSLRSAFAGRGLLNPGKLIPEPGNLSFASQPEGSSSIESWQELGFAPADHAEACRAVVWALGASTRLIPCCSGQNAGSGEEAEGRAYRLSSRKLNRILEYDPANQVVTVQAGLSLESLQHELGSHCQWLPIRPVGSPAASLGGLVARNGGGPERLRYGSLRDLVLGIGWVGGSGVQLRAGGRVLKNVAGYDLTRLLIGSGGSLGFITQITLKVSALPETTRAISARGSLETVAAAAQTLLLSKLEPTLIAAVPSGPGFEDWRLTVSGEGFEETVDFQIEAFASQLERFGLQLETASEYPYLAGPDLSGQGPLPDRSYRLRIDVPLDRLADLAGILAERLGQADLQLDFGCGRLYAAADVLEAETVVCLASLAGSQGGFLRLEHAPPGFLACLEPSPGHSEGHRMTQQIKQFLDPSSIFPAWAVAEASLASQEGSACH
jgi:glycolate oxidase subunit GlcD